MSFLDLSATQVLVIVMAGVVGGLAYDYYYKLLTMATYLSALEHVGAGAVAALLTVFTGALGTPTDAGSFILLAGIGYGGTDVIDGFIQKLQAPPASGSGVTTSSAPAPPA